jgi:hypothetical protein
MIRKFLKDYYKLSESGLVKKKPAIICNDGFFLSVQANEMSYCEPQENLPDGNYESVEVYISDQKEIDLECYSNGDFCKYVPIDELEIVILKHGGIKCLKY